MTNDAGRARPFLAEIEHLVIAGWTGRDAAAVEAHIAELERLGVKRPKTAPIFYRVAASLLTAAPLIEVAGPASSGEVEPVMLSLADGLWVGVGSDHTDRAAEAVGVTLSKQMCAKPISAALWRYDEVAPHWDALVLRSWATIGGARRLYQEGAVAALRPPAELMARYAAPQIRPRTGHRDVLRHLAGPWRDRAGRALRDRAGRPGAAPPSQSRLRDPAAAGRRLRCDER